MGEVWGSLKAFAAAISRHGYSTLLAAISTLLGLLQAGIGWQPMPLTEWLGVWQWLAAGLGFLLLSAFLAFHDLRMAMPSESRMPDASMKDFIDYVARYSRFAAEHEGNDDWCSILSDQLADNFANGVMQCWGRDGGGDYMTGYRPILEQIPQKNWKHGMVMVFDYARGLHPNERLGMQSRTLGGVGFSDLHILWSQGRCAFPPLPFWRRWRRKSLVGN